MHPNRLESFWHDERPNEREARLNREAAVLMRMGYAADELFVLHWWDEGEKREMVVPRPGLSTE